jgi:hypothetical protein
MTNREVPYTKVLTDNSSFQLVRTNPKLTGNVKLTINEAGEMWLNAIKANRQLANDTYSKVPIDVTRSHPTNLYSFFNNGAMPNEIIFDFKETVDVTKTSNNYRDQFDFSDYFSGARYLTSNKYSERISYLAPLYLKKEIPNYFVIFKLNDPLNVPIDQGKENYENGQSTGEYIRELFKKGSIIKTFDLRPETSPGKYLKDYLDNVNFPISPLTVSFEEDELTSWNGIVVNSGVFGNRGEYLSPLYQSSTPLKFFEENITNGFSRNGIIFPNILNLEFIFNDDTSNKYDFNRYLGVYVNSINLADFNIDLEESYIQRSTWENTPRFRKPFISTDDVVITQSNQNGILFPFKDLGLNLSEFSNIFSDVNSLYFNTINDKRGNLYLPKLENPYTIEYTDLLDITISTSNGLAQVTSLLHGKRTGDIAIISSTGISSLEGEFVITVIDENTFTYTIQSNSIYSVTGKTQFELHTGQIRLSNTSIDLGQFFGPSQNIFLQDEGSQTSSAGHSHIYFKVNSKLSNLDEIRIYYPNGTRSDGTSKYDLITVANDYSLVPEFGDYYAYHDFDGVTGHDTFYINGDGYIPNITSALAGALNAMRNTNFSAYAVNEYVFIKLNISGDFDNIYSVLHTSPENTYHNLTINGNNGNVSVYFNGGSPEKGNRLIIDADHLSKIEQNISSILVKSSNGWSNIRKVSKYSDIITESNISTAALRNSTLSEYFNKIIITLSENETPTVIGKEFLMKLSFKPTFGLLSMFPLKDIDFDFYESTYLNFPIIDLYNHYFIPEKASLLSSDYEYEVKGTGTISIEGVVYSTGDIINLPSSPAAKYQYSIVSGSPLVTYSSISINTAIALNDANSELIDFPGFSILKDPSKVVANDGTDEYKLRTKYLNGLTTTEYDYYRENESLDFATRSKMIPYITKWGIKNGTDTRDNKYRLNTELVFGRNNFSPDHNDRTQNPLNFTHEWFYIESKFNYIDDIQTAKLNNQYFEIPFNLTQALNDPNYFSNYFTYTPTYPSPAVNSNGIEVSKTQLRYSSIFKNSAGQYEAFFKGFKLSFKEYLDNTVTDINGRPIPTDATNRFEDYRFSCLLKPIKENILDSSQSPVKFKIVEHRDYKFITVIIELVIGDNSNINSYWKEAPSSLTQVGFDGISNNFASTLYSAEFGDDLRPYETINGDYRISFDEINNISNLTHTFLYSLKHKKFNTTLNNFSNIKLSSKLSLSISGVNGINLATGTIKSLDLSASTNYPSILSNEFPAPNSSTIIRIHDNQSDADFFISPINGFTLPTIPLNSITGALSEFLVYDNSQGLALTVPSSIGPSFVSLYTLLPSGSTGIIKDHWNFSVIGGGEKALEKLFEIISFANFKKYVNESNPIIEYYSYSLDENGIAQSDTAPSFYLEILDPSIVSKSSLIIPLATLQVPNQFSGQSTIGYEYEQAAIDNVLELNRYKGEYEPLVTDILSCTSIFKFKKNKISDISLANTVINPNVDSLFTIKNFNHIKISNNSILLLESDSSYLPVYPKIGEIPIGQADYFLLNSNWDWGFHIEYLNKFKYSPVAGSIRIEEDNSFISKLITLPSQIDLEKFTVSTVASSININSVDLDQFEIVLKDEDFQTTGYINLNNVLTRYLIEDGISAKFNQFLVSNNKYIGNYKDLNSYIVAYIKENILKLYTVENIEFYTKKKADLSSSLLNPNSFEFVSLTDNQRFSQGYSLNKALQINKSSNLILKFSFSKNLGAGLSISPKIKINFI